MGLTILAFAAAIFLAFLVPAAARRTKGSATGRLIVVLDLSLALFCLLEGLVNIVPEAGPSVVGLWTSRTASAIMAFSSGILVAYAFAFPRWLGLTGKIAAALFGALAIGMALLILGTMNYMASIVGVSGGIIRTTGKYYALFSDVIAAMAITAAIVHAVRALTTKDRIHRQRSTVAFLGVALGALALWIFARVIPARSGIRWSYSVMPLVALFIGVVETWSFSLSRLFDWRENGRTLLSYFSLTVLFGLPAGAAVLLFLFMGRFSVAIPIIGTPLIFGIAFGSARSFAERRLERLGSRREYREELESALAHIDLAEGRDYVLGELEKLLTATFDFRDFALLIEDERGVLRTVRSSGGGIGLERGAKLQEHIERSGVTVLVRSEAQAEATHEAVRAEFLELYDALKSEVLIFIREGRRVIGAFSFGARKTGGDYKEYDYETFRSIYGKLFVFAYYLKNVARESILYTVDRELALSDQVVRFALEKVDSVDHPAVDAAWATHSTRSLGGDFVDFVRLSRDRWFFVLGDVSGKGLSASMNMLILKSMIRTFLRVERDFSGLVQRVNAFIKDNLPRGTFFAGLFGYFDLASGSIYYLNCGIPALLLYSPSFDSFVEVQGEGKVLGFVRDVSPFLKPRKLALPSGSVIMAVTDGVLDSESLRGDRFGKDRLVRSARERLTESARQMVDGVVEDLLVFTDHKQEDDITLFAMKMLERRSK